MRAGKPIPSRAARKGWQSLATAEAVAADGGKICTASLQHLLDQTKDDTGRNSRRRRKVGAGPSRMRHLPTWIAMSSGQFRRIPMVRPATEVHSRAEVEARHQEPHGLHQAKPPRHPFTTSDLLARSGCSGRDRFMWSAPESADSLGRSSGRQARRCLGACAGLPLRVQHDSFQRNDETTAGTRIFSQYAVTVSSHQSARKAHSSSSRHSAFARHSAGLVFQFTVKMLPGHSAPRADESMCI